MGYAMVFGLCMRCGTTFGFNPRKVPSFRVNGEKEPICHSCILYVNTLRREMGIDEFVIPEGAYEAIHESEL